MVETIANSNLVQTVATFISGAGLYILCQRYKNIFNPIGYFIAFGIFFSFLFNVGEVYQYSFLYKRAFYVFGDDITTIIILFFSYAVLSGNSKLSVFLASSMFLSGGKVSFVLLLLMIIGLLLLNKKSDKLIKKNFLKYITVGLLIYAVMLGASSIAEHSGLSGYVREVISTPLLNIIRTGSHGKSSDDKKQCVDVPLKGIGACRSILQCFDSQVKASVLQRYYSSLGGLWMTLEGGYRGSRYPSSSDDFANLMIQNNPWGINDRYGLDFNDWKRMGLPQNPYLHFGSGYGPWFLGILILLFFFIALLGLFNLLEGEESPAIVFSIFFIVIVLFNQTQIWLTSGSPILLALGFCAYHILRSRQLIHLKSSSLATQN